MAFFQVEKLFLFGWTIVHNHLSAVVSSIKPRLKNLLILFVPGTSKFETKRALRNSPDLFTSLRFSSLYPSLNSSSTMVLSFMHDDKGSFNVERYASKW